MTEEQKWNEMLASELKKFLEKNNLHGDTRIYFNEKCWHCNYKTDSYELLEDILGTDYFDYANNETVSMSFEGALYMLLNHESINNPLRKKFEKIFEKHNCYYEFGHAWSLSVYHN